MEEGDERRYEPGNDQAALRLYASSFEKVLYEEDETFLEGMKKTAWPAMTSGGTSSGNGQDSSVTGSCLRPPARQYLSVLNKYYERQFAISLPAKCKYHDAHAASVFSGGASGPGRLPEGLHSVGGLIMTDFPEPRRAGFQHILGQREQGASFG